MLCVVGLHRLSIALSDVLVGSCQFIEDWFAKKLNLCSEGCHVNGRTTCHYAVQATRRIYALAIALVNSTPYVKAKVTRFQFHGHPATEVEKKVEVETAIVEIYLM